MHHDLIGTINSRSRWPQGVFGVALITLSLLFSNLTWSLSWLGSLSVPGYVFGISGGVVLLMAASGRIVSHSTVLSLAALSTLIFCFSSFATSPYQILDGLPRGRQLVAFLFLVSPLFLFFLRRTPALLAIIGCLFLALCFLLQAEGRLIFSDDHPTFLFRLMTLKESFPRVPTYYALWNAGIEFRDFFASGALGIFLIFFPLIHLFPLPELYNTLIVLLLFAVVPLSTYFSLRLLKRDSIDASLAALLSVSTSGAWYRWALSYGTIGFVLSVALLPLVIALTSQYIEREQPASWRIVLMTIVLTTLYLLWPIGAVALLPLLFCLLPFAPVILRSKNAYITLLFILVINLPWMVLFSKASQVASFLERDSAIESSESSQTDGLHQVPVSIKGSSSTQERTLTSFRESFHRSVFAINPLLLFFPLLGLALWRDKAAFLVGGCYIGLLIIGFSGAFIKPQLELDRFLVGALLLSTLPTGVALGGFFRQIRNLSFFIATAQCAATALLLTSLSYSASFLSGRTRDQIHFASAVVGEMTEALKSLPGDGRVLFTGFTLHELSEGHLAPLTAFTGKALIARSYKHDHWSYVDVIPEQFRKRKREGVEEFLDLYNVSAVITHDRFWRKFFLKNTARYSVLWTKDKFTLFGRIQDNPGYFIEGRGTLLSQSSQGLMLKIDTDSAIVRFHYYPFITADNCSLSPYRDASGVEFIKLERCTPESVVTVQADPPFARVFVKN